MTIFADVYTRLKDDAGVSALVGTRIYPHDQVPQNPTYPLVTFWRISSQRKVTMTNDGTLVNTRFQIDAWADTRSASDALIEACRLAMTGTSTPFKSSSENGPIDLTDSVLEKQGTVMDFSVWHN